jgi:hypothetical protein
VQNKGFGFWTLKNNGVWYRTVKTAANTSAVLFQIRQSGLFKSCRLVSSIASGGFGIFEWRDGNLYEIRVEPRKFGTKKIRPGSPQESPKILAALKGSGIFVSCRDDLSFGSVVAMFAVHQIDANPTEEYQITVMPYGQSQYQNYFIDTKAREQNGGNSPA